MSEIPDSSDKQINFSRNARNLHGWSVQEWIEACKRMPERTLPNGVGAAIIAYYEENTAKEVAIQTKIAVQENCPHYVHTHITGQDHWHCADCGKELASVKV